MMIPRTARTASPELCAIGSSIRLTRGLGFSSSRPHGQAVVEFGLVVLLFVLLISGMFDLGVLLNARLSISSLSRVVARAAAADATTSELKALANGQGRIIGVTTDTFAGYCCDPGDAIVIDVAYYSASCSSSCSPIPPANRAPGDRVVVDVSANGSEVFTPFARPAFGCTDGSKKHCFVPIKAQTTMRVERTYP